MLRLDALPGYWGAKSTRMADASASKKIFSEDMKIAHFDWRHQAVTTTVGSNPPTIPQGTLVKAVAIPVFDHTRTLLFGLPSTPALMISFAKKMHDDAQGILDLFEPGQQPGQLIGKDDPKLFDLIEKRMASVLFAYTSLEAFANEQIAFGYRKATFTYVKMSKGVEKRFTLSEVEKGITLGEKLNDILPQIIGVSHLRGSSRWARFRQLEDLRHRIVHNKEIDRIPVGAKRDDGLTLWALLTSTKYRDFALDVYDIVKYFLGSDAEFRWFEKAPFM